MVTYTITIALSSYDARSAFEIFQINVVCITFSRSSNIDLDHLVLILFVANKALFPFRCLFLDRFVASLRARLKQLYPSANCTLREDHMVHVHFKEEIGIAELIPLVTTYIILFAYIYFSTRKRHLYLSSLSVFFLLLGE